MDAMAKNEVDGTYMDIEASSGWNENLIRGYLQDMQTNFTNSGIDISQLGIKGYSASTDLSKLSEAELKEILN
jgi:hypothetical protein